MPPERDRTRSIASPDPPGTRWTAAGLRAANRPGIIVASAECRIDYLDARGRALLRDIVQEDRLHLSGRSLPPSLGAVCRQTLGQTAAGPTLEARRVVQSTHGPILIRAVGLLGFRAPRILLLLEPLDRAAPASASRL
ncbi:hypothetical protein [Candidatus Nitrospira bockiana]